MTNNSDASSEVLSFTSEITDDMIAANEFTLLDPGDYLCRVTKLEKTMFNGNDNVPACPVAVVELCVLFDKGHFRHLKERVFLLERHAARIKAMFVCLKLIPPNYFGKMPWEKLVDSSGKITVDVREYQKNGETKKINYVKKWLEPAATTATEQAANSFSKQPENLDEFIPEAEDIL